MVMPKFFNRVKETTDSTGTGTIDLNGAAVGFQAFMDRATSGDKVYYAIVDDPENPVDWELGVGTITAGTPDTLTRDTVEESSNSDNKVSFSAGTKTVICTPTRAALGGLGPIAGWALKNPVPLSKTANYTITSSDDGRPILANASANSPASLSLTLPSLAAADAGFVSPVMNTGDSGTVTVADTNSPVRTINGEANLVLSSYESAILWWNGSAWFAFGLGVSTGSLPRMYLSGLEVSNNGTDSAHDLDIAAGEARSDDDTADIALSSTFTKLGDATFAEGSGNGGMASGESLPASGTIHVWAIAKADGTSDVLLNNHASSALSPTLPSGFTVKRRIASLRTDSSNNILGFSQDGDEFLLGASVLDVNVTNPGISAVLRALSVPAGIKVRAKVNWGINDETSGHANLSFYISSPDQDDQAPSITAAPLASHGGNLNSIGASTEIDSNELTTRTNTSSQVRTRLGASDANTNFRAATLGWFDRRGRG